MREVVLYTTRVSDSSDVDLLMLPIINSFMESEKFLWLSERDVIMKYRFHDTFDYYHTVDFVAEFEDEVVEFMYKLKFGNEEYLDNK